MTSSVLLACSIPKTQKPSLKRVSRNANPNTSLFVYSYPWLDCSSRICIFYRLPPGVLLFFILLCLSSLFISSRHTLCYDMLSIYASLIMHPPSSHQTFAANQFHLYTSSKTNLLAHHGHLHLRHTRYILTRLLLPSYTDTHGHIRFNIK
ncbi:hypothetical protein BDQ12DRAFT_239048 [Crucibulum laeve]|uniref:Uncharacterized protein n=1 Tax=Crucibulum laeve TaxID=68775 RepID=A0A5C3LVH0_9AGAR|nr:hypothetical protein BDQ12DRAFT_239048 [Crucibulum laeve]